MRKIDARRTLSFTTYPNAALNKANQIIENSNTQLTSLKEKLKSASSESEKEKIKSQIATQTETRETAINEQALNKNLEKQASAQILKTEKETNQINIDQNE